MLSARLTRAYPYLPAFRPQPTLPKVTLARFGIPDNALLSRARSVLDYSLFSSRCSSSWRRIQDGDRRQRDEMMYLG